MSTYVVSDLHGEFDKFIQLLNKIEFDYGDMMYILGDVLDRGPEPIKLLNYIKTRSNMELLKGNHEQMFLDYLNTEGFWEEKSSRELLMYNGGMNTLYDYDRLDSAEKESLYRYLKSLPLYKVVEAPTGDYILVHSGLDVVRGKSKTVYDILEEQSEEDLLWSREEFYMFRAVEGYTVIFGHTPVPFIHQSMGTEPSFDIWYDDVHIDKIGIDCGATFGSEGGKLACLRLDDLKEYYI